MAGISRIQRIGIEQHRALQTAQANCRRARAAISRDIDANRRLRGGGVTNTMREMLETGATLTSSTAERIGQAGAGNCRNEALPPGG